MELVVWSVFAVIERLVDIEQPRHSKSCAANG